MDNKSLKRILNDERVTYVVYASFSNICRICNSGLSLVTIKCFR